MNIAQKMAASSSCPPREWTVVRKKWQDFASLAKSRGAAVRREIAKTGAGLSVVPSLTPDEEKALSIIGHTASQGISGGIDVRSGKGTSTLQPSGEGTSTPPPEPSSPPQSSHASSPSRCGSPPRQKPAPEHLRCEVECQGRESCAAAAAKTFSVWRRRSWWCCEGIEAQLEMSNSLQREMLEVKKAKLDLLQRQYDLAEAQFHRPSISVPIILPSQNETNP
ncbi:uncharacterized protein LOC118234612 [Anguilla anguilla]|uniref:uncharacterized protein LOC118234612 n=1 Tax=Anguilla anguilla TaxID=7936 RepID=UPI0015AD8CE1|nr:uncharacterized protein LOC118234612 [Anguilla anguilla]